MIAKPPSRRPLLGLLCCVLALCGACSRGHTVPEGVAYASYRPSGTGGDSAQLAGVLEVVSGCLVVREGMTSRHVLPVWPDSRLPAEVGQQVNLEGGYVDQPSDVSIPGVCAQLQLETFIVHR